MSPEQGRPEGPVIGVVPAYNEAVKISRVVERASTSILDSLIVVDDGSTDSTREEASKRGAIVVPMGRVAGVGAAIRRGFAEALSMGAGIVVVMAGNDKDDPGEIPRLIGPIERNEADIVQGSRYLSGGGTGRMPLYRRFATRLHPFLMRRLAGVPLTDSTNGFRAVRSTVIEDERLGLDNPLLDGYELEPFLLIRAVKLGYRLCEMPVTKIYPPRKEGYTKMRPLTDWWAIMRPIFWAATGLGPSAHSGKLR